MTVAAHLSQASSSYTAVSEKLVLETAEWGKANEDVAASIQKTAATNEAVVARLHSVERSHSEQTAELVTSAKTWSESNAAVSATMSEMISLNEEIGNEVAATRSGLEVLQAESIAHTQSWGDSGRAVASSMEQIAEENEACQSDSAKAQSSLGSASKAMQAQCAALSDSTTDSIAAAAALRGANETHSEKIQGVSTAAAAGFTSTLSRLAAWSDHQAEKVSNEVSQVEQLMSSRPPVLEALDASCASMKRQIAASAEALRKDTDTQQDVLADACKAISATWTEFCSEHNGTCAQIEDDSETWRVECQAIIDAECERLSQYEATQRTEAEESTGAAQAHSVAAAEQTVATTQTVRNFCNQTLRMEESVRSPTGPAELPSVARQPATTPQDDELLADCRTKRAAPGSAAVASGSPGAAGSGNSTAEASASPEQPAVVQAINHVIKTNAVLASPSVAAQRPRASGKIVAPGSAKGDRGQEEAKANTRSSARLSSSTSSTKKAKTATADQAATAARNPFAPARLVNAKQPAK